MPGLNFGTALWLVGARTPYYLVVIWGAILCYRRGAQRPHGMKWARAAIVLLIASSVGNLLIIPVINSTVPWFRYSGLPIQLLLWCLTMLPFPVALGMLFWAIFGDVDPTTNEPLDNEPPVFRYDDGTEAPK